MLSNTTKARMGAKGAITMARHPTLRRVTVRAGAPPAKLGLRAGKVAVKRKASDRVESVAEMGRTIGSFVVIYGPMAAEVFGLVETPKPKRRAPAFVAGIAIGAGALYGVGRIKGD